MLAFVSPRFVAYAMLLTAVLSFGGMGVYKYRSMEKTVAQQTEQIAALTQSISACNSLNSGYEAGIIHQNKGIAELTEMNELLVIEVEDSKKEIRRIRKARDMALDNLGKVPVPLGCEAKFDWMIDRAQEMKQ